jgi:mannose-6-phosphate isomerase
MGTHPSGPATLADGTTTLRDWIAQHPEALGAAVAARFGAAAGLPYLFKVLSVRTALSIQSHPDKALAERLHASNPKEYKDDNHKPEMALALADFSALCGFAPPAEIKAALRDHGELRLVVGDAASDALLNADGGAFKPALKAAFTALMTADPAPVASAVSALVKRLEGDKAGGRALSAKEALVLTLNGQYPGDVGVLSAFFLNHVRLGCVWVAFCAITCLCVAALEP